MTKSGQAASLFIIFSILIHICFAIEHYLSGYWFMLPLLIVAGIFTLFNALLFIFVILGGKGDKNA